MFLSGYFGSVHLGEGFNLDFAQVPPRTNVGEVVSLGPPANPEIRDNLLVTSDLQVRNCRNASRRFLCIQKKEAR